MTATSSLTGAPRNALRFWAEGRNIFVEIPSSPTCPDQPACIIKFPYGPVGLAKALDLLNVQRYDYGGEILTSAPPTRNPILHSILRARGLVP